MNNKKYQADVLRTYMKDVILRDSYNSNHIAGNNVSWDDVYTIIVRREFEFDDLSPKIVKEFDNYHEAADYMIHEFKKRAKISEKVILTLHKCLMTDILDDSKLGVYRTESVTIKNASVQPYDPEFISSEMKKMIEKFNQVDFGQLSYKEGLREIFRLHVEFELIHPFIDGNGRVGRLLLNYVLILNGFPPLIIEEEKNKRYQEIMHLGNKEANRNWESEDSLDEFVELFKYDLKNEAFRMKEEFDVDLSLYHE